MKQITITMGDKGEFSVNGTPGVSSAEMLGFLELAKTTVLRDIMMPKMSAEGQSLSETIQDSDKMMLDNTNALMDIAKNNNE